MNNPSPPVPMILTCPSCSGRHIDEGEFAAKVHHTHACQHCGMVWRPAIVPTVGVQFLPGFKNPSPPLSGEGVSPKLRAALGLLNSLPPMTPEEIEAQRQSFIRAEAPCEHGNPDWDICPKCREQTP